MTEPERLPAEQLRTMFLFEHLSDEQLTWLAERGRVVAYPAGATIHAEGAPASCFFLLLSGTIALLSRVQGGEIELSRSDFYGAYTGAFYAYLADQGVPQLYRRPRGRSPTAGCSNCPRPTSDAVREWFPMAAHLLEGSQIQGRAASDTVSRHERLVALGSVTAGLTHELNNPVAAVLRASARLRDMLTEMREKVGTSPVANFPPTQLEAIADLAGRALDQRRDAPTVAAGGVRSRGRAERLARGPWRHRRRGRRLDVGRVGCGRELARTLRAGDATAVPRGRPLLSGAGPGVRRPARRDHRRGRAHLGVARIGQAVHANGPRTAPDVRRSTKASTPP